MTPHVGAGLLLTGSLMGPFHEEPEVTAAELASLREAINDVVAREAVSVLFQPIVDLSSAEITGYEALTRPDETTIFSGAAELFDAAERCGLCATLEHVARRRALEQMRDATDAVQLFMNNSPAVFSEESFVETIVRELEDVGGVPSHRLVLEITERSAHGHIQGLTRRSLALRERGFSVALDDVGAGISGLNQIMSLRPNWIKLDIELISDIDLDPLKQNLIRSFVHFAKLGNMGVVAEGIEREDELRVLIDLGVSHGQGFYLGRPGVFGAGLRAGTHARILELRERIEARRLHDPGLVRVTAAATPVATCDYDDPISLVRERLSTLVHQSGVVVLDRKRFVGWVSRPRLADLPMGRSPRDAIGTLAFSESPLIGADWTLAEAMEIAAARPEDQHQIPLVVQKDGNVVGMVSLRNLLTAAAETHRRTASHIAPLTGLPSRVQADRWLTSRIKAGDPSHIAFVDLRDFDAYNVAYGFEKGDAMLISLVGVIKATLVDVENGAAFFGHLGEDRFVLAFAEDPEPRLRQLVEDFGALHAEFFSSVDLAASAFRCDDALGQSRTYPLTTLRVVLLPHALQCVVDPRELYQVARRLRLRTRSDDPTTVRDIIVDHRGTLRRRRESA
ncbi:MAG: EAL domain-containing protein [Planctomycetes bacterium]|nr:EAL domain-containing protein [Planctomycetota bacterium]